MLGALLSFLGFARLGFILNFVSGSVIAGFLQAQGLTGKWLKLSVVLTFFQKFTPPKQVPLGQLKKLLGVHNDSDYFIQSFVNIFTEIFDGQINWFDFAVGISTIILIVSISYMDRIKVLLYFLLKHVLKFLVANSNYL